MSDLKPCPFCGCGALEGPYPVSRLRHWWTLVCGNTNCGAEISAHTPAEVTERWNRRANEPKEDQS